MSRWRAWLRSCTSLDESHKEVLDNHSLLTTVGKCFCVTLQEHLLHYLLVRLVVELNLHVKLSLATALCCLQHSWLAHHKLSLWVLLDEGRKVVTRALDMILWRFLPKDVTVVKCFLSFGHPSCAAADWWHFRPLKCFVVWGFTSSGSCRWASVRCLIYSRSGILVWEVVSLLFDHASLPPCCRLSVLWQIAIVSHYLTHLCHLATETTILVDVVIVLEYLAIPDIDLWDLVFVDSSQL